MLKKMFSNKVIQEELAKGAVSLVKKAAWLVILLFAILWVIGKLNIVTLPSSVKGFLGLQRQDVARIESIVSGELQSRAILAESTRDYTGNAIFEREGGFLNCAGEEQAIQDGTATARATVAANKLAYDDLGNDRTRITVPEATLDSVDLDENLEVISKRNPCVRLVQIFGEVTGESEVRTLLADEIEEVAIEDTKLFTSAECEAVSHVKTLLRNAELDLTLVEFAVAQDQRPLNDCEQQGI